MVTPLQGGRLVPDRSAPPASVATPAEFSHPPGSSGGPPAAPAPPQYGRTLAGAARFIGRLPDLWQLHSALTASDSAIISQSYGPGLALVSGLGRSSPCSRKSMRSALPPRAPGTAAGRRGFSSRRRATGSPPRPRMVAVERVRAHGTYGESRDTPASSRSWTPLTWLPSRDE